MIALRGVPPPWLWVAAAVVFAPQFMTGARADDTSVGVMLPGLHSEPAGSVTATAASLILRARNIEVTLAVTVQSGQGASVTIETPRFGWLGEAEPYPDRQFPELGILVGGVPATLEYHFTASVGTTDVTQEIRAAGVDPFVISDSPPFVMPGAGAASAFARLESLGAVEKSDDSYLAKWTAQREIKVALGPGSSENLALTYKARPGYALRQFDEVSAPTHLAGYCLAVPKLRQLLGYPAATHTFVVWDYAIPVGIDDRPLTTVAVEIGAPSKDEQPRSLVAFCGADGKGVTGQGATVKAPARTDPKGVIHILSISAVDGSK